MTLAQVKVRPDEAVGEADTIFGVGVLSVTVTVNALLAVAIPSDTMTVINAEPVRPGTGVTFTVRFDPLPPKVICAKGTRVRLEEFADSIKMHIEAGPGGAQEKAPNPYQSAGAVVGPTAGMPPPDWSFHLEPRA